MKNSNELQRINKIHIVVLVICITVNALLFVSCKKTNQDSFEKQDTTTTIGITVADTNVIDNNVNDEEQMLEMMEIKTPYGVVNYPLKWSNFFEYEEKTENGVFTGTFYCIIQDQKFEIFNIYFGDSGKGTLIGHLNVSGELVPFSVDSTDYMPDDTWAEGEKKVYFAMLDGINDVIESVIASPNYIG